MNEYFGIRYEFDKVAVGRLIDEQLATIGKGYICVADGVVLSQAALNNEYLTTLNQAMFSVCDSSWVPVYIRLIYQKQFDQYSGSELFEDILNKRKYNMMFLGATDDVLFALRSHLTSIDQRIARMSFVPLPFCNADDFDFHEIANRINIEKPDIIWIGLGAPKQEHFMQKIVPYVDRGIMIGVGAVFKFYSGITELHRAPRWMIKSKIEWVYRLLAEPRKQSRRIMQILRITPSLLVKEFKNRKLC